MNAAIRRLGGIYTAKKYMGGNVMRNIKSISQLTAAFFITVFTVIGCASTAPANYDSIIADPTPTKFEGMWGHLNPEASNAKIIFSGNSFIKEWDDGSIKGRYSFNSSKIYFFAEDG
ncbi:MAG: hypothetical protein LBK40_01365, partial [Spirochaetaceae bacterium]|nr:hypothetical protein [Spirochaetaceae bacterium]